MFMRRPLDWIVVSISITVLFANRMLAPQPMELQAPGPRFQESAAEGPAIAQADNPFAYIREDGSLQFLPVAAPRVAGKAAKSRQATPSTALYTWSSPLILVDKDTQSFQ
jgi:hypothetical protein